MDVATATMLARYRAWGDKIYDSVAALPPGEAEKPHRTRFKTIIGTLNHNLLIDLVWQAHIEGRDHGFKARNLVSTPICRRYGRRSGRRASGGSTGAGRKPIRVWRSRYASASSTAATAS